MTCLVTAKMNSALDHLDEVAADEDYKDKIWEEVEENFTRFGQYRYGDRLWSMETLNQMVFDSPEYASYCRAMDKVTDRDLVAVLNESLRMARDHYQTHMFDEIVEFVFKGETE